MLQAVPRSVEEKQERQENAVGHRVHKHAHTHTHTQVVAYSYKQTVLWSLGRKAEKKTHQNVLNVPGKDVIFSHSRHCFALCSTTYFI